MDVDDVRPELAEPASDDRTGPRVGTDRDDGPVERDPHRTADDAHTRIGRVRRAGRQHQDLMSSGPKVFRELPHMDLDTAGRVPGVRAGEGDPHGETRSSQAGWNMCQSVGASEMYFSNCAAMTRVRAVTSSRVRPVRSTWTGDPILVCQP